MKNKINQNPKKKNISVVLVLDTQTQTQTAPNIETPVPLGNNTTNLGPLDWPWEEGVTGNGERYYINHVKLTTTWRDPRLCTLQDYFYFDANLANHRVNKS